MNKAKREAYKTQNEEFLTKLKQEEGVKELPTGILYKVIQEGSGEGMVLFKSKVTCNYRGSLVSGYVFDDSWKRGKPEKFKTCDLIGGFQTALRYMHLGDHWIVYIPYTEGYGTKPDGDIPGYSTLIFEIELLKIE